MTRDEFEQLVLDACIGWSRWKLDVERGDFSEDASKRAFRAIEACSTVMSAWDAREKEARDALDAATRDMEEARKTTQEMKEEIDVMMHVMREKVRNAESALVFTHAALGEERRKSRVAREEMSVMRAALEDFAEHGTRSDLNPTHVRSTAEQAEQFYTWYLKRMDDYVRGCARRALGRE